MVLGVVLAPPELDDFYDCDYGSQIDDSSSTRRVLQDNYTGSGVPVPPRSQHFFLAYCLIFASLDEIAR